MANSPSDVARLLAVSSPHAFDWLNALPISSCGLRLDDDVVRVLVGLRLGLQICESHRCVCDSNGWPTRPPCTIMQIRNWSTVTTRHAQRYCSSGFHQRWYPSHERTDGSGQGMRTAPWRAYIDPLGRGSLPCVGRHCHTHTRADKPRSLGSRRRLRRGGRSRSEIYQIRLTLPFAFVRPSCPRDARPFCKAALDIFVDLGKRIAERTGDPREGAFLFQILSIAIQRGNAAALHGSLGEVSTGWLWDSAGPVIHYSILS